MKKSLPDEKILIAGFGGQGIMFLGRIIAQAAVEENKNVTYIRSYGAEMRGGTAHCLVKISKRDIASPVFKKATISLIFNQPSLEKFKDSIEPKGILLLNKSLIKKILNKKNIIIERFLLNELALKIGNIKVANTIALGILLKIKPFLKISSAESALKNILKGKQDILTQNLEALKAGYSHG